MGKEVVLFSVSSSVYSFFDNLYRNDVYIAYSVVPRRFKTLEIPHPSYFMSLLFILRWEFLQDSLGERRGGKEGARNS